MRVRTSKFLRVVVFLLLSVVIFAILHWLTVLYEKNYPGYYETTAATTTSSNSALDYLLLSVNIQTLLGINTDLVTNNKSNFYKMLIIAQTCVTWGLTLYSYVLAADD